MKVRTAIAVVAMLASVAVPAAWSAGGVRNLAATPKVKAALRAAFIRTHSNLTARSIRGPLRGRTYYSSAGAWRDLGDTGGDICPPTIPLPLLKVWNFQRSSTTESKGRSVQCYAPRP